jgi:GTP cyclohydrolase I
MAGQLQQDHDWWSIDSDVGTMNLQEPNPDLLKLPDVQASRDTREIAIAQVGIRALRMPLQWADASGAITGSVAQWALSVSLPADQKGTHMSRFIALLGERTEPWSLQAMRPFYRAMLQRLEAHSGRLDVRFPLFLRKKAPASGIESLMDYEITLVVEGDGEQPALHMELAVPVTSLCPCSKAISDYGAHNQRSMVRLQVSLHAEPIITPEALIALAEAQASSELYGLLKRADEKIVTERAYDNPKFVEDLVRDVAAGLAHWKAQGQIAAYRVEVENFESIHNHSAFAQIAG